ncbi:MAG TPA: TlpA disulfide reductase family protein [Telluria sp.]
MDAFNIGPLAIPAGVAIGAAAFLAATFAGDWFKRRRGIDAGPVLWATLISALLSARIVFVIQHFDIYARAPLQILNIRDSGFTASAGLLVGAIVAAELTRRAQPLRKPVLAALLAGAAVWLGGTIATTDFSAAPPQIPVVELRRLDGTPIRLTAFAGKPLVLNLWATWCGPCRREMPVLRDAQIEHPDVEFVFINQGENAEQIQRFLASQGLEMKNVVSDPPGAVAKAIGSYGLPTTLFFDRHGVLQKRHMGELSAASLVDRLAAVRKAP